MGLHKTIWVLLIGFMACSKPNPGQRCTADRGCSDGSDCLSISTSSLPNLFGGGEGICFKKANGDCSVGQESKELLSGTDYCVSVAPVGKPCGAELMCEGDAECLYDTHETNPVPGKYNGICRTPCGFGTICPNGEKCSTLAPNMPGITPENDPMLYLSLLQSARSFCMPAAPATTPAKP